MNSDFQLLPPAQGYEIFDPQAPPPAPVYEISGSQAPPPALGFETFAPQELLLPAVGFETCCSQEPLEALGCMTLGPLEPLPALR